MPPPPHKFEVLNCQLPKRKLITFGAAGILVQGQEWEGQGSILKQYILFISKTKIKMHHEDVMGYVYSIDEADRK